MRPITPASRVVLHYPWISIGSLHTLHVHRPAPSLPTLASPTKIQTSPNIRNISASRLHQVAQQLTSPTPSTPQSVDMSRYSVRKIGAPNTLEHRIYIEKDGVPVSPFHDIPLYANEQQTILNMVVEIPRWTNGKLEVSFLNLLRLGWS